MFLFQADVRGKKTLITAIEQLDYVSDAVNGFVFLLYWEIPIKAQPWNPSWIFGNRLGGCSVGARADLCVSFSSQSLKGQTCGILRLSCKWVLWGGEGEGGHSPKISWMRCQSDFGSGATCKFTWGRQSSKVAGGGMQELLVACIQMPVWQHLLKLSDFTSFCLGQSHAVLLPGYSTVGFVCPLILSPQLIFSSA